MEIPSASLSLPNVSFAAATRSSCAFALARNDSLNIRACSRIGRHSTFFFTNSASVIPAYLTSGATQCNWRCEPETFHAASPEPRRRASFSKIHRNSLSHPPAFAKKPLIFHESPPKPPTFAHNRQKPPPRFANPPQISRNSRPPVDSMDSQNPTLLATFLNQLQPFSHKISTNRRPFQQAVRAVSTPPAPRSAPAPIPHAPAPAAPHPAPPARARAHPRASPCCQAPRTHYATVRAA